MINIIHIGETDSTNDEAKRRLRAGEALLGYVITAGMQTSGRGRFGKSFWSPGGDSVYASFIIDLPENLAEQRITIYAAVAVCLALEKTTMYRPGIRGVNDLIVDKRKICGILAESVPGAVVLGIGVNINLDIDCFPEELREEAGSLNMEKETRARFFDALVEEVFRCMAIAENTDSPEAASLMDEYKARSAPAEKPAEA